MNELRELYQQVIIDHNKSPRNFHVMQSCSCHAEGFNPLCGDELTLYLKLDGDTIVDASFQGNGCAISTASASIMTEVLKGKTKQQAIELFKNFHNAVTDEHSTVNSEQLGKLAVLAGVKEFPARVKCATLAWHTLQAALKDDKNPVSTE